VLALDTRNRVLGRARVARGGVNQVLVTAREVFRPLVALGAARAIVAHNHPSGDPRPSAADAELTARLEVAGELIGIALVDHLVLAAGGHHSFARSGDLICRKSFHPRRRGNAGQGIGIG
jgi:DNA repair protein RadC